MKNMLLVMLVFLPMLVHGQIVIHIDQPEPLQAFAGNDTLICKNHSVNLGATISATGGSGDYLYSWYPNVGLDDNTIANHLCQPEETTTYMLTVTDQGGCTATSFVTVAIDPCLSIIDNSLSTLQIYPNPITDHFFIEGLPAHVATKVSIVNHLGQSIFTEILPAGLAMTQEIRLPVGLDKGSYFLHISSPVGNRIKTIQVYQ